MWSFVTPLRLKRANIFLSNYLEQGSPHIDGLHSCLTDGSPIKNPSESKKNLKKTKKMMMMIWLHQEEKKKRLSMSREKKTKKKRNGEHIRGKWIYDATLFKDHSSKIPSHLLEFLLSTFAFIPLALTTIQA